MKKYFLSIVALAGMLFATSCQESLVEPQVGGPTTFTVQVPDQMGTKAGEDSYKLFVEVYSADGTESYHRINPKEMAVGTATTVTLNLVANQAYDIIFWAQKNDNSYGVSDLRTVQMNANHHNSETGSAFYAVLNNYNPTQGKQDVKLTRPFAQLNLYTTNDVAYGKVNLVKSTITIEGVADKFNRVNQDGDDEIFGFGEGDERTTYTYTSNILPAGTKTIDDVEYQYVSMDYLAVPGNQNLVKVTAVIDVMDEKGNQSQITRIIEQVPVQMNYRTNIIGNLITSASDFKVEISEDWAGEDKTVEFREVSTAAELQGAVAAGVEEIVLVADIELNQPLVFAAPLSQSQIARASTNETSFVLDLNGKNLKGSISVDGVDLIVSNGTILSEKPEYSGIVSNGDLTLNNVNITSARHALRIESGKAVIDGGVYKVEPATGTSMTLHALNVGDDNTSAEVLIKNGEFIGPRGKNADSGSAVKVRDGSKVTIENGVFSGGKTETLKANQEDLVVKGGEFDQNPASWVAEGYKAVEVAGGKSYVVLPKTDNYDIVITDPAQLINGEVLRDYDNILLQLSAGKYTIDLYMAASFDANLTIIGTKGTKVEFAEQQVMMALVKNFTIKNCEILHMATKSWGMLVFGGGNKADGVYTIKNCTFNGVGTQGIYINENTTGATYNILNCTFNGDFGNEGAITIQTNNGVNHTVNVRGCEFNNVPANHRIFLVPDTQNGPLSYDFTLDTDLEVSTANELAMFLSLREDVVFANDIKIGTANMSNAYGKTGINVKNGQTIDGNGHTLNIKGAGGTWDSGINTTGGLIKDITVTGSFRGIFINKNSTHSEKVVLDNVTIQGTTYTISCDQGIYQGLTAKNSTFNGWTSYAATLGEAEFKNCSFGAGNGYKFCRPYAPTTFVGCDFCEGYTVDPKAAVTFENCTINGVALTEGNISTLVTSTEKVTIK